MEIRSGNVDSYEIAKKGDSTTPTIILQIKFSDDDDIQPVEWVPAPGEDSVPLLGSRVFVHELSAGYLVSFGGNDGATLEAEPGVKEIYSAAVDGQEVKKMARLRLLPDGNVELIAEGDFIQTIKGDVTQTITGNVEIEAEKFSLGNGTDELISEVIKGLEEAKSLVGPSLLGGNVDSPGVASTGTNSLIAGDLTSTETVIDAIITALTNIQV